MTAPRGDRLCIYCGSREGPFEPDHVEPLIRGGKDVPSNRVTACRSCNRAKGPRFLLEWACGIGRLTAIRLARGQRVGQLCLSVGRVAPFARLLPLA